MTGDAAARLAYLDDAAALLWPGGTGSARVVLPSRRLPRLLVPVRPSRAGAGALLRYTAQQGVRERGVGLAVAAAAAAGLARLLPTVTPTSSDAGDHGEPVDALLTGVLGQPVDAALALTPRRANRKPVLQVFDRRGRTVAFAKIGVSPLARDLVDAEAHALAALARAGLDTHGVDVPRVLHHGPWRGTSVLVTTVLPLGRRARHDDPLVHAAMRAVADAGPPGDVAGYLDELRTRVLAAPGDSRAELLEDLATAAADVEVRTGSWHGDWTAWNCARRGGRLAVWDWERFTGPVPRGFDTLHFRFNDAVGKRRTGFGDAAPQLVAEAGGLLGPWGTTGRAARLVAGLYLFDLALRYVTDRADDDAARAAVEGWARPAIRDAVRPDVRGASTR